MAAWTSDELNKIGKAEELQIAGLKTDGLTSEAWLSPRGHASAGGNKNQSSWDWLVGERALSLPFRAGAGIRALSFNAHDLLLANRQFSANPWNAQKFGLRGEQVYDYKTF